MAHAILIKPLVTEKSLRGVQNGKYTFAVSRRASKLGVERLVRITYNVEVLAVNIAKVPTKPKQRGIRSGLVKAVVTLPKGQTIKGFALPLEADEHNRQLATEHPAGKRHEQPSKDK